LPHFEWLEITVTLSSVPMRTKSFRRDLVFPQPQLCLHLRWREAYANAPKPAANRRACLQEFPV